MQIGGGDRYKALRNGFIIAAVNPNANRTLVQVQGYLVENIATFPTD